MIKYYFSLWFKLTTAKLKAQYLVVSKYYYYWLDISYISYKINRFYKLKYIKKWLRIIFKKSTKSKVKVIT